MKADHSAGAQLTFAYHLAYKRRCILLILICIKNQSNPDVIKNISLFLSSIFKCKLLCSQ